MTKEIPLTQGQIAFIDDGDYELVMQYKWYAVKDKRMPGKFYARGTVAGKRTYMHRFIMNATRNKEVDHRDGNGLNNRRESNLRLCTHAQNQRNQHKQANTVSRYKGVVWFPRIKKWASQIKHKGKQMHLGVFSIEIDAAKAYDSKARELHGEFASLNFPDETQ